MRKAKPRLTTIELIHLIHKRYKCLVKDQCTNNVEAIPIFNGNDALYDIRNYLPICSKHRYHEYAVFDKFDFVKSKAPILYEILLFASKSNDPETAARIGYDNAAQFFFYNNPFHDYINQYYNEPLWELRQNYINITEKARIHSMKRRGKL